jgi:hypothetical protein
VPWKEVDIFINWLVCTKRSVSHRLGTIARINPERRAVNNNTNSHAPDDTAISSVGGKKQRMKVNIWKLLSGPRQHPITLIGNHNRRLPMLKAS